MSFTADLCSCTSHVVRGKLRICAIARGRDVCSFTLQLTYGTLEASERSERTQVVRVRLTRFTTAGILSSFDSNLYFRPL